MKEAPAASAAEGIVPKPDNTPLGDEQDRIWRAYYGEDASLLGDNAALSLRMGPTPLDLRVQKRERDSQEWVDAPVGQKLRLIYNAYSPSDGGDVPTLYCDETVTAVDGTPPQNISVNALSFGVVSVDNFGSAGMLFIYAADSPADPFDCADGWADVGPDTVTNAHIEKNSFIGTFKLRMERLPSHRITTSPPPSSDAQTTDSQRISVPLRPMRISPLHLP